MKQREGVFIAGRNAKAIRERLLQELPHYIKSGMQVIDVGAGDLTTAIEVHDNWVVGMTAIDLKLPYNNKLNACIEADLDNAWPLTQELYDLVISTATIEHCENPYHFMRELARILKRDGIAIISTHNTNYYWSKLLFLFTNKHQAFPWGTNEYKTGEHRTPLNEEHLTFCATMAGLQVIRTFYGNPNLRLFPYVDGLHNVKPTKWNSQEFFLVIKQGPR